VAQGTLLKRGTVDELVILWWVHAGALQGQSGIHEDEIMGVSLDASLAKEEAAEQDVVSQLRLRAGSLERDLLQRSLDGLAPNSKVQCPLAPCAMPSSLCNAFTPLQCLRASASCVNV